MSASAFYEGRPPPIPRLPPPHPTVLPPPPRPLPPPLPTVAHRRHSVREHAFRYRISMAYLDLDEVPGLRMARGRFRRGDHIGDPGRPLRETVRELAGPGAPQGPVRVLTNLRTLGHCFNPVCFYYLFEEDGETLGAVVAEVTNTPWGDRHAYVLRREGDGRVLSADMDKQMHVSPFMGMDQRYVLRAAEPGRTLSVHIENREDGERVFGATLNLERRPLSVAASRGTTARRCGRSR